MSEYTPTEARLRERVKGSLGEYAHEFGLDGEAAMDEWIDQALAERDNRARADERAKLQDRIEVLEKNLAYEVAQKIKLAEQLQAATTTSLTLEQARWKMHAGIDSRCSEEVAAKAKPVIDLVLSSLALEPETREEAEYFRDGDGDLWKFTDKGEWFHEEETGSRLVDYINESAMRSFLEDGFTVGLDGDHHWEVVTDGEGS